MSCSNPSQGPEFVTAGKIMQKRLHNNPNKKKDNEIRCKEQTLNNSSFKLMERQKNTSTLYFEQGKRSTNKGAFLLRAGRLKMYTYKTRKIT